MKHIGSYLSILSALLVTGCGTVKTSSSTAPGANLSGYHTFSFAETKTVSGQSASAPAVDTWVQRAIRQELEQRGLHLAQPADLLVCMYLGRATKTMHKANPSLDTGSMGSDLRTYYGLIYDDTWSTQRQVPYKEGTLLVQVVDVQANRAVWEGTATGVIYTNETPAQVQGRLREAVSGMFKTFPAVAH